MEDTTSGIVVVVEVVRNCEEGLGMQSLLLVGKVESKSGEVWRCHRRCDRRLIQTRMGKRGCGRTLRSPRPERILSGVAVLLMDRGPSGYVTMS